MLQATQEELGEGVDLNHPLTQAALEYITEANNQIQKKQYKRALELFHQSILIKPLPVGYCGKADICMRLRIYHQAYENYQTATKLKYSYAIEKLIKFLLKQFNIREAQTLLFQYFVQFPKLTLKYRQIWFYTQNYQKVVENQEIQLDVQDNVDNTLLLMDILFQSGHRIEAFSLCYRMVQSLQNVGFYLYKAVEFLFVVDRFEEAILLLNFLISSNKMITKNYKLLAKILAFKGRFSQARALINDLLKIYPSDTFSFQFLMWLYTYTNNVQLGIQQFDQEIETCPQLIELHLNKCYGLFQMGIYNELLEYLKFVESQFGENHKIVKYKIKCLFELKEYDKCIQQCELMQQLKPISAKGYYIKCLIYLGRFEFTKFISSFEQGIKLKPVSYKFNWLKRRYHQILNQSNYIFSSIKEESYINRNFFKLTSVTTAYHTNQSYQMDLAIKINQIQSLMSTQNYFQSFSFYLLSNIIFILEQYQQFQSFDLDESLEFNQYFTLVLWTVAVYLLSIHSNVVTKYLFLEQFTHFNLEYQDSKILCILLANEYKLNQINTRYSGYDYAYKFEFQLGVACNYYFKKRNKVKPKLSLTQERLITYYSIYQSEHGQFALIDSFKILKGIQDGKIDLFVSEDYTIQIIDSLEQY